MKRFFLIISLFFTVNLFAQESFNYQASILTKEGLPAANRTFRVSIKVGNDSFFIANFYQEIIQVKSGNYGYLTFEVGKTGSGKLSNAVEWSKDVYIELQITTIDNLERIDIPIKHRLNFSPKAIYAIQAGKSLLTDLALKSINADTSAFSKTGAWSLKSDSAKHSINSDTAQYSLVAKWSSRTDSALHAINADTSEFSKTGAWALKSDSAKYAINIADSIVTNEKLAGAIAATKLIGTDIDKVGTLTLGEWKATPISDQFVASSSNWNAKQDSLFGKGYVKLNGRNIVYDSSTYISVQDTMLQDAKFRINGTAESGIVKLHTWNRPGIIGNELASFNIQQLKVANSNIFQNKKTLIGHNLYFDGYSFVRRDKEGKGLALLMAENNLFLVTDTTSVPMSQNNSIVPVQYQRVYTESNFAVNSFVPSDLLNNYITNYSPNQLKFLPQAPSPNSGIAGLRMDKKTQGFNTNFPHGFIFSVDDNFKWDIGLDFENEDLVLAYNHKLEHRGDFIRMSENNRIAFGTAIGTPKFENYKYTFLTTFQDSIGLGGLKIKTYQTQDTALKVEGVLSGLKANFSDINIDGRADFSNNRFISGNRILTTIDSSKFGLNIVEFNNVSLPNYTLTLSDASRMVNFSNSSTNTITLPTNAIVNFPVGTKILITQMGLGKVIIQESLGVTLNSAGGANKTKTQYSVATLVKTDTDTWLLYGDIEL